MRKEEIILGRETIDGLMPLNIPRLFLAGICSGSHYYSSLYKAYEVLSFPRPKDLMII